MSEYVIIKYPNTTTTILPRLRKTSRAIIIWGRFLLESAANAKGRGRSIALKKPISPKPKKNAPVLLERAVNIADIKNPKAEAMTNTLRSPLLSDSLAVTKDATIEKIVTPDNIAPNSIGS